MERHADSFSYSQREPVAWAALLTAVTAWLDTLEGGRQNPTWEEFFAAQKKEGALTIELRVNGQDVCFTAVLNAIHEHFTMCVERRAAALLGERAGEIAAQLRAVGDAMVEHATAKSRELFPGIEIDNSR